MAVPVSWVLSATLVATSLSAIPASTDRGPLAPTAPAASTPPATDGVRAALAPAVKLLAEAQVAATTVPPASTAQAVIATTAPPANTKTVPDKEAARPAPLASTLELDGHGAPTAPPASTRTAAGPAATIVPKANFRPVLAGAAVPTVLPVNIKPTPAKSAVPIVLLTSTPVVVPLAAPTAPLVRDPTVAPPVVLTVSLVNTPAPVPAASRATPASTPEPVLARALIAATIIFRTNMARVVASSAPPVSFPAAPPLAALDALRTTSALLLALVARPALPSISTLAPATLLA